MPADVIPRPTTNVRHEKGEARLLRERVRYLYKLCRLAVADPTVQPADCEIAVAALQWARGYLRREDDLGVMVPLEKQLTGKLAAAVCQKGRVLPEDDWFYAVCHFCPRHMAVEVYRDCHSRAGDTELAERLFARFGHFRRAAAVEKRLVRAAYAFLLAPADEDD